MIKLTSILVPVDFSAHSRKAFHYALTFARQFEAKLFLLHVVEPVIYPTELGYMPLEMEALQRNVVTSARERLASMATADLPVEIASEQLVRMGSPYLEITAAAREMSVDLLVIATHGYTGLKHVLLGSTAERVIRHAPCPVLTVREREHDFV
jgi:universal stress protein A